MMTGKRRTDRVRRAIDDLLAAGHDHKGFLPRDVNRLLREQNAPMGAWEVRGELSRLEQLGELKLDAPTGRWLRAELRKSA